MHGNYLLCLVRVLGLESVMKEFTRLASLHGVQFSLNDVIPF